MGKIIIKSEKVINIMRCLTGCFLGTDRNVMLMIYRAMIRANLDYWCLTYGRARPDIVGKILMMVSKLERKGSSVGFLWVSAHVGVEGNEVVERAAKASLGRKTVDV